MRGMYQHLHYIIPANTSIIVCVYVICWLCRRWQQTCRIPQLINMLFARDVNGFRFFYSLSVILTLDGNYDGSMLIGDVYLSRPEGAGRPARGQDETVGKRQVSSDLQLPG